jgi:hypothetical protein
MKSSDSDDELGAGCGLEQPSPWQLDFVKGEDFEAAMLAILPDLNQAEEYRLDLGSMQLCWEACFGRKAAWGVALE